MRGRVALFVLLLLSSFPIFPQCSWTPRASAQFRTTALDVAVDGSFVWLATGYGVQLFENDEVVDTVAVPDTTRVVRPDGSGLAYVGSGTRIYVLRRDGRALSIVRSVDAGASVNDIELVGDYLFAATANGIGHFDVFDPANPIRTSAFIPTSSPNVTGLAATSTRLYAADGDDTLEVFSISTPSIPQRIDEVETLQRITAVHATSNGNVYVSDAFGQSTQVFSGTTSIGMMTVGANSLAPSAGTALFVAGTNRTLRAVELVSSSVFKTMFEHQLAPAGGTDNAIHAIARSGNTLYVAAGDIGLAIFDISSFVAPYPLAAYREQAPSTSVAMSGDRAWFADDAERIIEKRILPAGLSLTTERTWTGGKLVHDVEGSTLLTSTAKDATLWSLTPQTPSVISTSSFRANVVAAAIHGQSVVALLDDGTVWLGGATPQQVTLPRIAFLARAGNAYAFVETRDEGKTVIHHFASPDLAAPTRSITVDGIALGGLALDATRAAVFTFSGISVIDVSSGSVRVIADSTAFIPRHLAFSGDDLLVLDARNLVVYDDARTLVRQHFLPADGVLMDAQPSVAVVATSDGTLAASYLAERPEGTIPYASRFYSKVVTGGDRVYLFGPGTLDIHTTISSDRPLYMTNVNAAGVIDIAATSDRLFTLSAGGIVRSYSKWGAAQTQMTIDEGPDAQPLSIDTAGNAVWVSVSKGCASGECQKKTLILDPATLGVTSSITGGVTDVVTSGTRAYVLLDLPVEMRALDITDPLHPSQLVSAPAPATGTSIAAIPGHVYVIGDKLYDHAETTLMLIGTQLANAPVDKAQQIRIEGNCAVITARGPQPLTFDATTWTPATSHEVPVNVRSVAQQPGRLFLLTTHSLEVWSTLPPVAPGRRRAVR